MVLGPGDTALSGHGMQPALPFLGRSQVVLDLPALRGLRARRHSQRHKGSLALHAELMHAALLVSQGNLYRAHLLDESV